jgi:hypoxanthine-guanine phosphoribosyltransferase
MLRHHQPASLNVCVLLNRASRRIIDIGLTQD